MIVSLIVAASDNEVIGRDGTLPWYLPGDLRRFKRLTLSHVVVMGRVTHESVMARLGRPLPGRTSVVLSRTQPADAVVPDGVRLAGSLETALRVAEGIAGDGECFVAGGADVYEQTLPLADRVYLTRVHLAVAGDRRMPDGWLAGFGLAHTERVTDDTTGTGYSFLDYQRVP